MTSKLTSADAMARSAEVAASHSDTCYRCGESISRSHDGFWCPALAQRAHAGRWIPFEKIRSALEHAVSGRSLTVARTCRAELPDGAEGEFHDIVGVSVDGAYVCRFDTPSMPEFGLCQAHNPHEIIFAGWRGQLRQFARKTRCNEQKLFAALQANADRTTEEVTRYKIGWL